MRLGILGGTFDPVHLGHLIVAEEARVRLNLEKVLFIPTGQPWMKAGLAITPAPQRRRMVELAISSNPHFQVAPNEVERAGPTYTLDTLRELLVEWGQQTELHFILGLDALEQFHRWKEPELILELCQLVVVSRAGYRANLLECLLARYPQAAGRVTTLEVPNIGISSTEIRRRAAGGISFRYQVPKAVEQYILENQLYRTAPASDPEQQAPKIGLQSLEEIPLSETVRRLLQLALEKGALQYGDFTLSSGKKSAYYFDGRLLSLDPEGAHLIGQALLPLVQQAGAQAIGGPTLGADPIVAAVALTSHLAGNGVPGFIVRKEAKAHGTGQNIEGPLLPGSRVAIVDDTCTTGGSLFQAIAAAEAAGCTVVKVIALLDRREGGTEELARRGYDFTALLAANATGQIEVLAETG